MALLQPNRFSRHFAVQVGYASIPAHEQTGLRSPKTLSTRLTCGQNL